MRPTWYHLYGAQHIFGEVLPDGWQNVDIVYIYYSQLRTFPFAQLRPEQTLLCFIENPEDSQSEWAVLGNLLDQIRSARVRVVLLATTNPVYRELADVYGLPLIQCWTTVPWTYNVPANLQREPFFLDCGSGDPRKGYDIIRPLIGQVPVVAVGADKDLGCGFIPVNHLLGLQARSLGLLFAARHGMYRSFHSAICLGQIPILLRTTSEFWKVFTFGNRDTSLETSFPIADNVRDFYQLVRDAFARPADFYGRWHASVTSWRDRFAEFWSPWVVWEQFQAAGLPLSGDLLPLHNIFWAPREFIMQLPEGPWKKVPMAENLQGVA